MNTRTQERLAKKYLSSFGEESGVGIVWSTRMRTRVMSTKAGVITLNAKYPWSKDGLKAAVSLGYYDAVTALAPKRQRTGLLQVSLFMRIWGSRKPALWRRAFERVAKMGESLSAPKPRAAAAQEGEGDEPMSALDLTYWLRSINREFFRAEVPESLLDGGWDRRSASRWGSAKMRFCPDTDALVFAEIRLSSKLFRAIEWDMRRMEQTLVHELTHVWLAHKHRDTSHGARFQAQMRSVYGPGNYTSTAAPEEHAEAIAATKKKGKWVLTCPEHGEVGRRSRRPKDDATYSHRGCSRRLSFVRENGGCSCIDASYL